jgi:hypothetical protein
MLYCCCRFTLQSGVQENAGKFGLVLASNILHITPFEVTLGLMAGASRALGPSGRLIIYGPFKVDGKFTTQSNEDFDTSLKSSFLKFSSHVLQKQSNPSSFWVRLR